MCTEEDIWNEWKVCKQRKDLKMQQENSTVKDK